METPPLDRLVEAEDSPSVDTENNNTPEIDGEPVHVSKKEPARVLAEEFERFLKPVPGDSPVGVNIKQLLRSDEPRKNYTFIRREIGKTIVRDINFERCASLASELLSDHSKDLQVAVWMAIAVLNRDFGSDSERLQDFRDSLIVIKKLMETYSEGLYPVDEDARKRILQRFASSDRLTRLSQIETRHKRQVLKLTQDVIDELRKQRVPPTILNDVKSRLLDLEVEGVDTFRRYLKEEQFDRFKPLSDSELLESLKKSGAITEANREDALSYYRYLVEEKSKHPVEYFDIRFRVSQYAIDEVHKHFPDIPLPQLDNIKGETAVREDIFEAQLERFFEALSETLEESEIDFFRPHFFTFCNENRWVFAELKAVIEEFNELLNTMYGDEGPSLKTLYERVEERVAESEELLNATGKLVSKRKIGFQKKIEELEQQLADSKLRISAYQKEIESLKGKVDTLSTKNKDLEETNEELRTKVATVQEDSVEESAEDQEIDSDEISQTLEETHEKKNEAITPQKGRLK